ncbi:MAG: hypothetical protein ACXWCX_27810 [Burkholderiales bacterium]
MANKADETTDQMMARNTTVRGRTVDETAARKDGPRVPKIDEHIRRGSADQQRGTRRR